MAQLLYNYFIKAAEIGGIPARARLSILSKITSTEAKSLSDDQDKLDLLAKHFKTIEIEFGAHSINTSMDIKSPILDKVSMTADKLRKQMSIFADFMSQRLVHQESFEDTVKRVTETLVEAIDVERASIWLYNDEHTAIECVDLYIRKSREHVSGISLNAASFPNYFESIKTEKTIAAFDAHRDPRTNEFSESYLRPLGINSMLDVPIYVNGKMAGVVCHEHVGDLRKWNTDEETFAYIIGNVVGMMLESNLVKETVNVR